MSKKKSHHSHGHYCKICGEYNANEKFSVKRHAAHICKACSRLSPAEKSAAMTVNRLMDLPVGRLSASNKAWLENRLHDHRPEIAAMAREVYNLHFPYAERNAIRKQLIINSLVFEIQVELPDIFGEDIPINKRFTANQSSRILTMADFDADNIEQNILLNSGRMSKLFRWAVHNLEIFMRPEDYDLLLDPDLNFILQRISARITIGNTRRFSRAKKVILSSRQSRTSTGVWISNIQIILHRRLYPIRIFWKTAQERCIMTCCNILSQTEKTMKNLYNLLPSISFSVFSCIIKCILWMDRCEPTHESEI